MKTTLLNSILVAVLFVFTACGGGETSEQPANETETTESSARTIDMIGLDTMKFAVAESEEGITTGEQSGDYLILETIEASAGEEITVRLTTESDMPASAMSHNFVLLTLDADADAFARASITARDNDYISPDNEDQVIVHTEMLGGGESDSVTFTVPEEPGEYTFICSFPGHYAGGMVGTLVVQ